MILTKKITAESFLDDDVKYCYNNTAYLMISKQSTKDVELLRINV